MKRWVVWLTVGVVCLAGCLVLAQQAAPRFEPGWTKLFNGKDLDGWEPVGNAKWTVQDGVLVGEQNNGQPGELLTKQDYDNFELSVVFKMVWPGNSGVWFRKPLDKTGYQMDILDKKEYGVTVGTIYSDGFLARNEDESIVKLDDWNTVIIACDGPHITVTLNGTKTGDITDTKYATGRIGFQVHAGANYAGMKIMVKEAKIRRILSPDEAKAAAANQQCFVCHLDYAQEELTVTHRKAGVSCATCHGDSKGHIDDEDRKTAPDTMIAHDKVAEFCRGCHTDLKRCHHAKPPAEGPDQACTECHGKHKLDVGQ
jgi:3-keto-disaccharide hydrolase/Cytochrome c554 and c-prime